MRIITPQITFHAKTGERKNDRILGVDHHPNLNLVVTGRYYK